MKGLRYISKFPTLPKSVPQQIRPEQIEFVRKCTCCGTQYSRPTDFLSAPNTPLYRNNGGRMTVCKGCINALFEKYREELGDEEAIRRICMKFDMYFSPVLVQSSKDTNSNRTRMSSYVSKCNLAMCNGKTYDTTLTEERERIVESFDDLHKVDAPPKTDVVTNEVLNKWGLGFSPNDYQLLENALADWKAKCVIDGLAKETLVRQLCVLQLQQNKALLDNKVDVYQKLVDTFQKTLDRAELTPKIEAAQDRDAEKPMGVMIKMFEENEPVPDAWDGSNVLIRLITVYFLGHLCKMLGIKNRYSAEYEAEMAKYRVEVPALEDADDEDVFSYLMSAEGDENDTAAE